jgi:hypothetical protein
MDAATAPDQQALQAQLAQARERLDVLMRDLRRVDDELAGLAPERERHRLLQEACDALQRLGETGAASLFWGDGVAAGMQHERLRHPRSHIDALARRFAGIDSRRQALLGEIARAQAQACLLEDDVWDAQEEEERRKWEWIVEREVGQLHARNLVMPWTRREEDDRRFRKTLGIALLISLLFALILPFVDLPVKTLDQMARVPDRVVKMMVEKRRVVPPKPEVRPKPEERVAQQKPIEKVVPPEPARPDKRDQVKVAEPRPEESVAEKGILAFRDRLAAVKNADVSAHLGLQARLNQADDNSPGTPQRSMLTSSGPGSSGGINLASLSRGLGGQKGGGGGLAGVQVTRATSAIGGGAGAGASDRPLASGARPARTDEEIQIVFDRYKAALYRMYNRELRKDPTLRGQMVLRLTIEPDGRVSMCVLQASDMNAPDLSAQVVERVRTINFGAKDVDAITIVYPIDFLPAA